MPAGRQQSQPDTGPVQLDVIAPILQGMGFCSACELILSGTGMGSRTVGGGLDEYPPEWQDDYRRLSDWVYDFADRYGSRILIKVIDPQSPEGLFKSLRHRVRRYPTWVINGTVRIVGWDRPALEAALQKET